MKSSNEYIKYKANESKLKSDFNIAIKNKDFKEFVSKLNIPIETLMKYTSSLEECSEEYNHCCNCKNIMECQNQIEGYAYLPEINDQKIKFGYKACKYQNKLQKEKAYLKNIYCFDIPESIKQAKMKDIYKRDKSRFETIKWLTDFIENYKSKQKTKGLYLHGSFGSGKTYLIAACINELAKEGIKSSIVFWPEFLSQLKGSFGKYNDEYTELINKVKKAPLLLIDDLGAENLTPWGRDEVLCPILQYRMNESLPTFITSNFNYQGLENHFSQNGKEEVKARRIIERIKQLTDTIEMTSKNLRK